MIFIMNKQILILCVLALAGCGSESTLETAPETPAPIPTPEVPHMLPIDLGDPVDKFIDPIIEPIPEDPEKPVAPPEPPKPVLPIFIGDGITALTQRPFSGVVNRGGDAWLRYDSETKYFHDFELPEWKVKYKYLPMLEVLISDDVDTLCVRYSWKSGFGYAQKICNWSDTREGLSLDDVRAAYYGYSIVETRVWVSGVVGLEVRID